MNETHETAAITSGLLLECGVTTPSSVLRMAIVEDSNLLMDWMWYAERVVTENERRYCYERALYISPNHSAALEGLVVLNQQLSKEGAPAHTFHLGRLFQAWFRTPLFHTSE